MSIDKLFYWSRGEDNAIKITKDVSILYHFDYELNGRHTIIIIIN
jgi:hypothetical protein